MFAAEPLLFSVSFLALVPFVQEMPLGRPRAVVRHRGTVGRAGDGVARTDGG